MRHVLTLIFLKSNATIKKELKGIKNNIVNKYFTSDKSESSGVCLYRMKKWLEFCSDAVFICVYK